MPKESGTDPDPRVGAAVAPEKHPTASPAHVLRLPRKQDGYAIHQLIKACPPLDLNSVYTYLLLAEHFAPTCVLAERDGKVDGFVSAYIRPDQKDVVFVWQVAVHERARGAGLGGRMLATLLRRPALREVRYLETTVGPGNQSSRRMFGGIATAAAASIHETALFEPDLFGPDGHDDERLLRIGPMATQPKEENNDN